MRNQKGITLIALVITIIVLLILAGVTIAMLTGENGLLTRSTETTMENALAEAKDQITLTVQDAVAQFYQDKYANNLDNTALTAKYGGTTVVAAADCAVSECVAGKSTGSCTGHTVNSVNKGAVTLSFTKGTGSGTLVYSSGNNTKTYNVTTTGNNGAVEFTLPNS